MLRQLAFAVTAVTLGLAAAAAPAAQERIEEALAPFPVRRDLRPLNLPHFPDRVHAFIWRNWELVPLARIAAVLGATEDQVVSVGKAMGLSRTMDIPPAQPSLSYITVIRRNWHLLPYAQLLQLLDWKPEQLAFALREDDFLFHKLGNFKPDCRELTFAERTDDAAPIGRIRDVVRRQTAAVANVRREPLFAFVAALSERGSPAAATPASPRQQFSPRFCYSYFGSYGDPLLDAATDPYPDGYLERLAAAGVNGVWLQGVLYKLAPFPWNPELSDRREERLAHLRALVARAGRHGIKVYLYLNEPRAMPRRFFDAHPELRGVSEGEFATLCTSQPDVRAYLRDGVAEICRAVPELGGFFTITASENLTNCWSHKKGNNCPRCGGRAPGKVMAEVNSSLGDGIRQARASAELIAWDWGWNEEWVSDAINGLPAEARFMSVSEWGMPIARGGVASSIGEYSVSTVGPGERAKSRWALARERGLKTIAKIQANNSWEISAVPYVPALVNVATHAENLSRAQVNGLMLGWTLGGYPSPNLEVVAEISRHPAAGAAEAIRTVAERRFGPELAPLVTQAWRTYSEAFSEFPFGTGLYTTPVQLGPANLLYGEPTRLPASMVGYPHDDLRRWRGQYPIDVFIRQLEKVAHGFETGTNELRRGAERLKLPADDGPWRRELTIAHAVALHFRSSANQCRFVAARDTVLGQATPAAKRAALAELETVISDEIRNARSLYAIQLEDSRIGFEASNQYYYTPLDLIEKILNGEDLLRRWLPALKSQLEKRGG